jgi:hypothetical protein
MEDTGLFGTREGDMWLVDDSPVGEMVTASGDGSHLVKWFHDGEEALFVTADPEMIAEATRGAARYAAERAAAN